MTKGQPCLLYTQDAELLRRVRGFLRTVQDLRHLDDHTALKLCLDQSHPALLLLDSRISDFTELLMEIRSSWGDTLVVVIGPLRSNPVIHADAAGAFAVLDVDFDGNALKRLVRQGFERLALVQKLQILEEKLSAAQRFTPESSGREGKPDSPLPLRHCFPPLRRFDDVRALLQGTMDAIVNAGVVFRAGIFVHDRDTSIYRFEVGVGCSDEARELRVPADYPLVRWLDKHAQLVCRSELQHVAEPSDRLMLERSLDLLQAELLVPLLGQNRIVGWIVLGRLATGAPFSTSDLQDVMILSERVSTALENAILYKELARQKSLAETLLHSVPTGIIAAREDGRIYWFNEAAERILDTPGEDVMGQPVEVLGHRLAGQLRLAIEGGEADQEDSEWFEETTKRHLSVATARLMNGEQCGGTVAFVHDLTRERMLTKRQRELDRSAFWTELAANMSHEIRNPLVAIKTFAQLLPERYSDSDFRSEFSVLVSQEVDRLNSLIEQINSFAQLPEPSFERLDIMDPILEGVRLAKLRLSGEDVRIKTALDNNVPNINGDRGALVDCFAHIVSNSLEALRESLDPKIELTVRTVQNGTAPRGVEVSFRDNAGGIKPELRDKVFSPFCTGRNGGMGLGLPIVQRTVMDHEGQVHVESDEKGTDVSIVLPAYNATPEEIYEASANR